MDNIQKELEIQKFLRKKGSLEYLKSSLGIKTKAHPTLPLVIFNYDHILTPHDNIIGVECRGLVLEYKTWNIVAKPMYRFYNWGELSVPDAENVNMNPKLFDFNYF